MKLALTLADLERQVGQEVAVRPGSRSPRTGSI